MIQWIKCLFGFHIWGQQLSNNFMWEWNQNLTDDEKREFCHGCFKMKPKDLHKLNVREKP